MLMDMGITTVYAKIMTEETKEIHLMREWLKGKNQRFKIDLRKCLSLYLKTHVTFLTQLLDLPTELSQLPWIFIVFWLYNSSSTQNFLMGHS